jgi:spermidine/putrescine ABC transporter ATP-binding subunit
MTDQTSPTSQALLRIENVSHNFGDTVALDNVSLEIRSNEFFALLGPSGCGKTTLLRVLAGFETPDAGSIWLGDQDLVSLAPNHRPINLMFQSYALFPHMSVEANIAYGLLREKTPKPEIRARVDDVLEKVGLIDKRNARPNQLSGGQRQRVALARAIVKRPKLLLLDEPLSALDKKIRAEMQLELKRLQHEAGITFVVVTHDQEEAMSMADRIAVMSHGKVVQVDTPRALYENPANLVVADFIGRSNVFLGKAVEGGIQHPTLGFLPGRAKSVPIGTDAALIIRPESIRVATVTEAVVSGRIIDVQYLGGSLALTVEVAGQEKPLLVTSAAELDFHRDQIVHLSWITEQTVTLAR